MSSEQKKFAPELMGGASLLDRIRNALSSILDIGKSARIRLSRITKPDYDVIKEILDNRDSILGHRFVAKEQKRAPPRDINMDKVNKVIEELKNVPNPVEPDTPDPKSKEGDPNLIVYEPPVQVDTTVPVEGPVKKGEIKPDVDVDTDVPVQEEVKESTGAVDENVTDGHEDGVSVTMSESVKDDAKEFDDVHSLELIDNVLSIDVPLRIWNGSGEFPQIPRMYPFLETDQTQCGDCRDRYQGRGCQETVVYGRDPHRIWCPCSYR